MELENLYVVIDEIMEIIPSLNNIISIKEMEDSLCIRGHHVKLQV